MSTLVRRLPWALAAVTLLLLTAAELITVTVGAGETGRGLFIWAVAFVFGSTGTLVSSRLPRNPIGWLFLTAAVSAALGALAGSYADYYVREREGSELLARIAAQYGEVSWMPFILLPATFLLALFPDGHLLSSRWRPVGWCAAAGIGGGLGASALIPGPIPDRPELTNPFGIDHPAVEVLNALAVLLIAIGMIGSSISLILRLRRSRGEERQQIKWLALAGAVAVLTIVLGILAYDVLGPMVADSLMMLAAMGLPVAAGIAILRYRLYDIDLVINRTLVYGTLSALLAATYLGVVLLLQLMLEDLTQGSGLAVAASTLATAAMVRPARARIQSVVDRRFFRRRYDAVRTVAEFGGLLREQVDLSSVERQLSSVVVSTMQPAHISLWTPWTQEGR